MSPQSGQITLIEPFFHFFIEVILIITIFVLQLQHGVDLELIILSEYGYYRDFENVNPISYEVTFRRTIVIQVIQANITKTL